MGNVQSLTVHIISFDSALIIIIMEGIRSGGMPIIVLLILHCFPALPASAVYIAITLPASCPSNPAWCLIKSCRRLNDELPEYTGCRCIQSYQTTKIEGTYLEAERKFLFVWKNYLLNRRYLYYWFTERSQLNCRHGQSSKMFFVQDKPDAAYSMEDVSIMPITFFWKKQYITERYKQTFTLSPIVPYHYIEYFLNISNISTWWAFRYETFR